jgi:hypothetical protein
MSVIDVVCFIANKQQKILLYILLLSYIRLRVDLLYHQWPRSDIVGGGLRRLLPAMPPQRLYSLEYCRESFDCPIYLPLPFTRAIIGPLLCSVGTGQCSC